VQNIFIAIITDGFQSLLANPVDKTGENLEDEDLAKQQSLNISLQKIQNSPKNEEKLLSRKEYIGQKSKLVFKKLLTEAKAAKDNTPKFIAKLDTLYADVIKCIEKLVALRKVNDPGVNVDKLREVIDKFLFEELMDLAESYLDL
jgi:hypothetical protein